MAPLALLAAFVWDPQIRGALIVITAVLLLPGSVYLLLSTNLGAKVGLLVAAGGLFGWMAAMGWVWVGYGIGIKGHPPEWHVKEVITGDIHRQSTIAETKTYPGDWRRLEAGNSTLGDASAAASKVLIPEAGGAGHAAAGGTTEPEVRTNPLFDDVSDFVQLGGYETGAEAYWLPGGGLATEVKAIDPLKDKRNPLRKAIDRLRRGPFHQPHLAVVEVAPTLFQADTAGAPPIPKADPAGPITHVVMERDLGNLRFPSTMFALSFTILFALVATALHRRDREIMAAKAALA